MCMDDLGTAGNTTITAAYSFGINGWDGWGCDVAQTFGIPLFEYDCYNPERPEPCEGRSVTFKEECIKPSAGEAKDYGSDPKHYNLDSLRGKTSRTMDEHLEANGHAHLGRDSLLLKLDIE